MRLWTRIALVPAAAVLAAAGLGGTAAHAAAAPKAPRLVPFRSCGDLLGYTKAQAGRFVSPYGIGTPVAATSIAGKGLAPSVAANAAASGAASPSSAQDASTPQEGIDYSGTNVQEQGVDEPDIVKTDGKRLFAVANGYVNAVDVTQHQPVLLGSLKLDSGWSHELLLHGNRLLVLSRGGYWAQPLPAMAARMMVPSPSQSTLTMVDVSDPKAMHVTGTLTLDGAYVDARMVNSVVRVVSSAAMPVELPLVRPVAGTAAALADSRAKNAAVISS